MHVSGFDDVLWALSVLGRLLLLGVLISRLLYRPFPVFTAWILFGVVTDPIYYLAVHLASPGAYDKFYFAMSFPDALLQIGIVLEIISNILRPVKRSLPRGALIVLGILVVLGGAIAFVLAAHLSASTLTGTRRQVVVDSTLAIVRLTIFLGMACFAQVLGIGWKNHVLQMATGLGFYSAASLIIELLHSYLRAGLYYTAYYEALSRANVICYLGTLAFWCWSFTRQEAERKEFSGPMRQFVLFISGDTKRFGKQ